MIFLINADAMTEDRVNFKLIYLGFAVLFGVCDNDLSHTIVAFVSKHNAQTEKMQTIIHDQIGSLLNFVKFVFDDQSNKLILLICILF